MSRKLLPILLFTLLLGCSGGGGSSCDLADGAACGPDEYCKAETGTCTGSGKCESIPDACDASISEVCTCDRLTFFNECLASQAGQSLLSAGSCS